MVVIVSALSVDVEDLSYLSRLPSVDELRPGACPLCRQPARPPGKRLGIVGHGTYLRQVLGRAWARRSLVIRVRRFLCRGCLTTISVLPDALLPRRWYAGGAILLALTLSLLSGVPATEVRRRFSEPGDAPGWKTLQRWERQLLAPLWSWFGAQMGFAGQVRAGERERSAERLLRLLGLHGADEKSPSVEIEQVACALVVGTAHSGARSWEICRAR